MSWPLFFAKKYDEKILELKVNLSGASSNEILSGTEKDFLNECFSVNSSDCCTKLGRDGYAPRMVQVFTQHYQQRDATHVLAAIFFLAKRIGEFHIRKTYFNW